MPEHMYLRVDLAREQLGVALELFLAGRSMVSVITLAGAAEEVLGKAVEFAGGENSLTYEYAFVRPIKEVFRSESYALSTFIFEMNHVRNAAKHLDDSAPSVAADLEEEAVRMLVRACRNYDRLGFPMTPEMRVFDDWYMTNMVGISCEG
jgi:hypothetical protein